MRSASLISISMSMIADPKLSHHSHRWFGALISRQTYLDHVMCYLVC